MPWRLAHVLNLGPQFCGRGYTTADRAQHAKNTPEWQLAVLFCRCCVSCPAILGQVEHYMMHLCARLQLQKVRFEASKKWAWVLQRKPRHAPPEQLLTCALVVGRRTRTQNAPFTYSNMTSPGAAYMINAHWTIGVGLLNGRGSSSHQLLIAELMMQTALENLHCTRSKCNSGVSWGLKGGRSSGIGVGRVSVKGGGAPHTVRSHSDLPTFANCCSTAAVGHKRKC